MVGISGGSYPRGAVALGYFSVETLGGSGYLAALLLAHSGLQ